VSARPSVWRHIWRDVILLGLGSVGVVAAQLAFRSILIAALVPASYGKLSLVLSIYNTVWILGTSGLPNSVSRYLAINGPADDRAIVRAALRANGWLTLGAASIMAVVAGILLHSLIAAALAGLGLAGMVYSLLTMGILRGRGKIGRAASVMPIAALGELVPLALLYFVVGADLDPISGFATFCLGNLIGVACGVFFVLRTRPRLLDAPPPNPDPPGPRQLLGFSLWLAAATAGLSALPLIVRSAAAFDSYTLVAVIDVALVLFTIPQRLGTVIVLAAIPRASKAVQTERVDLTIPLRGQLIAIVPFALAAALIAFTPWTGDIFAAIGRPEYGSSAKYLALALLAGPARILYGLVESALVAHGEGRFLAYNVLSVTGIAAVAMIVAAALGSVMVAFLIFVAAFWIIYFQGMRRVRRLAEASAASAVPVAAPA
jgi:O-antigen/teichoic acid export membrane protein